MVIVNQCFFFVKLKNASMFVCEIAKRLIYYNLLNKVNTSVLAHCS